MGKFLFSLLITSLILFFLLQSVFGENGLRENEYIKRKIVANEELLTEKKNIIKDLEEKVDIVSTSQHIINVMNKVGYAPITQTSYIFQYEKPYIDEDIDVPTQTKEIIVLTIRMSFFISVSTAFVLNILIFVFITTRKKRERKKNDTHKKTDKTIGDSGEPYTIY